MNALAVATWVLGAAVAMGVGLIALHLMGDAAPRFPAWPGWLHGALGAAGTAATLVALAGPARGLSSGAGSFGGIAAAFLAATLAAGVIVLLGRARRRPISPAVVAVHAMLGIAGYVMLAAWWSA